MEASPPQILNEPGGARVQGGPLGVLGELGVAPVNLGTEAPGPIRPHPNSTLPPLLTRSFLSLARCVRKTALSPEASSSAAASECQCRVTTSRGGGEVGPRAGSVPLTSAPEPLMVPWLFPPALPVPGAQASLRGPSPLLLVPSPTSPIPVCVSFQKPWTGAVSLRPGIRAVFGPGLCSPCHRHRPSLPFQPPDTPHVPSSSYRSPGTRPELVGHRPDGGLQDGVPV